jgi:hypothetical protein
MHKQYFPCKTLLSEKVTNLPPKSFIPYLTHDQYRSWLNNKQHWTNIYEALTLIHCEMPVNSPYWKRIDREYVLLKAERYLCLYKLIKLNWDEIVEKIVDMSQVHYLNPDDVLTSIMLLYSEIEFSGCLDNAALSPQKFCKEIRAFGKGENIPIKTSERVDMLSEPIRQLNNLFGESKNLEAIKELRNFDRLEAELRRVDLKITHESNGSVKGGTWKDGVWKESRKGERHNPNPKQKKLLRSSSDWEAAFGKKQRRCQCQICQIPHRRQVNENRVCFDCFLGRC